MEYSNTFLKKYESLVDDFSYETLIEFGVIPKSMLESGYCDDDVKIITERLTSTGIFKNLWKVFGFVDHEGFKSEIYSNLSCFAREKQEKYYCILLLDFLEKLEKAKRYFQTTLQIILKTQQRLATELGYDVYSEGSLIHPLLEWEMMFEQLLENVNQLSFTISPVLMPYLEKDNELLINTKFELQTFLPAHAKVLSIESPKTNEQIRLIDLDEKDNDLNVKVLIAHQSGLLTGDFHKLPIEKQYAILGVLFGRSKANVKNAVTSLMADANTAKNPRNLPKVVEKANDLIIEKDLGINLIKNR